MASINPHRFRLFPHRGFDAQLSTCNQGHIRLHTEFVPAEAQLWRGDCVAGKRIAGLGIEGRLPTHVQLIAVMGRSLLPIGH